MAPQASQEFTPQFSPMQLYKFKLIPPVENRAKLEALFRESSFIVHMPEGLYEPYAITLGSGCDFLQIVYPDAPFEFVPYFVHLDGYSPRRRNLARKKLDDKSPKPTLGKHSEAIVGDPTAGAGATPKQDQYPVPYFLYGHMIEHEILATILGIRNMPELEKAEVVGGIVAAWAPNGEYCPYYPVLINADDHDTAVGWMFMVNNKDQEDILRHTMGDSFEVVRCEMKAKKKGMMKALTFRYIGSKDRLIYFKAQQF